MKISRLICFGAVFAGVCLTPAAYADGVKAAIEAVNAQYSAAAAKGDVAALLLLYSPDAQVMPVGGDPIRGRQAIQKMLQTGLDSAGGSAGISLKTLEVYGNGPTATEVGEYQVSDKAGKVLDHGKYIVIWKHADGKWRIFRDMPSTSVPPPKK